MKRITLLWLTAMTLSTTSNASAADRGATSAPVVVLELFTSQGCSSCPSADKLLTALGSDRSLRGKVLPLAFHVDYWNRLGWSDPFSSADWSRRQNSYAQVFRSSQVYTPQLVVNGTTQGVGSDSAVIRKQIDAALRVTPAAQIRFRVTNPADRATTLHVDLDARADTTINSTALDLMVALFENSVITDVRKGENSGRKLRNDFVVRKLTKVSSLAPGSSNNGSTTFNLDKAWMTDNLGVAAFLQDPKTLRIYAASAAQVHAK
ncbi:MAG TPA: DUF1223 domain-containing protein [Thermoanaerobaculia bacterium]|nr:DUF1223 domain-containing protein [Thermoanaerobaculia bacterium]